MKGASLISSLLRGWKIRAAYLGLAIVLLGAWVSGCGSVIKNSEASYKDRPQRPINWNEYLMN